MLPVVTIEVSREQVWVKRAISCKLMMLDGLMVEKKRAESSVIRMG